MKKIFPLFSILLLFACADKKPNNEDASIEITLKNSLAQKVYLVTQIETHFDTIAQADIIDGYVSVPYEVKHPTLMYVVFDNAKRPLQVYVDTDGIEIDIETAASSPIVKITGSEMQDKLEEYYEIEKAYGEKMQALQPLRVQAVADQYIADMLQKKEDSLYQNFMRQSIEFCKFSSVVGALIANKKIYNLTYAQADSIYQNIPAAYRSAPEVILLKDKKDILEKVAIGKPFTEIAQKDTSGNVVKLSELVKNNNYVLIDFWASWCQPCRRANPELIKIYNEYRAKGFEILSVSLDEKGDEWRKAVAEDQLPWPQVSQLTGFVNDASVVYGIVAIPQSVLINKYGNIEVKNLNEIDLRTYLSENL